MWKYRCEAFTLKNRRCKKNKSDDHFCTIHKEKPIIEPELCSICLEEPDNKIILECEHIFCKECVFTWLCKCTGDFNCPMCRKSITDEIKSVAWKYGEENKLLFRVIKNVYDTSKLNIIEYELIKNELILFNNQLINQDFFFLLKCVINKDIFDKILETHVKTQILLTEDLCKMEKQFYFIKNLFI